MFANYFNKYFGDKIVGMNEFIVVLNQLELNKDYFYSVKITLKTINKDKFEFEVEVEGKETILSVKNKALAFFGIDNTDLLTLILRGKVLENDNTIES